MQSIVLIVHLHIMVDTCSLCDSVQLARRMLELERANSSMRKQIAEEKATSRQLSEEVCAAIIVHISALIGQMY